MKYEFPKDQLKPRHAPNLATNLSQLDALLKTVNADAIILTSKDPFISEYVPLLNHQRYGATGFTGSTGDCIYWSEGYRLRAGIKQAVSLFVDGRYHLQADQETDPSVVEVVKLQVEPNIEASIFDRFAKSKNLVIATDPERISVAQLDRLEKVAKENQHKIVFLTGEAILKALNLPGWVTDRPIFSLAESVTGRTPAKLCAALNEAMKKVSGTDANVHVSCSMDDASFLLNARGYHMPKQSSLFAYTFIFQDEFVLFLPASSAKSEIQIDQTELGPYQLSVIRNNLTELKERLKFQDVSNVFFNDGSMNALLPTLLSEVYPSAKVQSNFKWVLQTRARKTPEEMNSIRSSFLRSSRAIGKTLRFGKSETALRDVSEVELADYLYQSYESEGAQSLSFSTICGAGPNSAIVHYSNPQTTSIFKKGQMALLDSGAYYAEGFATDCTRGFFVGAASGAKPEAWQKEIYTATLRAAISVFLKPVDARLTGKQVDDLVRSQVKAAGHDYLHGTGHGVGVHVHEEGIRFSSLSIYPQSSYACVSVEPGIYLKDQGGVRVENVVLLQPEGNPDSPTAYQYENVVFVGYDWDLIDVEKLTPAERDYLRGYEEKCRKLGTQLMDCPL